MKFSSSFCFGTVFHKRYKPRVHQFRYSMFMPLLDLDRIDELTTFRPWLQIERFGLYSFYETDYLRDFLKTGEGIKERVLRVTNEKLGTQLNNHSTQVLMLSQWRFLGRVFNPLTLFYLYSGKTLYLCAEVSNTPWNERHIYCFKLNEVGVKERWQSPKDFHVSPYNPMDMTYDWMSEISSDTIRLNLALMQDNDLQFSASFDYAREPWSKRTFFKGILKQPFLSLHTVFGIYWQALKLFIKRIPLYSHPDSTDMEKKRG